MIEAILNAIGLGFLVLEFIFGFFSVFTFKNFEKNQ